MFRSWRGRCLAATAVCGLALVLTGCPAPVGTPMGGPGGPEPGGLPGPGGQAGPGSYLFCFWNTENFFDDKDDERSTKGDKEYDSWFSRDPAALEAKLDHLCKVLLGMNDRRGPDILAVAELESERSAELLAGALNKRLANPELHYKNILFETIAGGRHIATAILTRLPVERDRTRLLDKRRRILEGRVKVAGKSLVVIASHWTSRLTDKKGTGRAKYADEIYGRYKGMYLANPKIDLLVCGDFNDNPDDPAVTEHLHAIGDVEAVRAGGGEPKLLNLFAGLYKAGEASHFYKTSKYLFDQICVSPGMLDDEGWSCDPGSAMVVKEMADRRGRPNRFGGAKDRRPLDVRGASDHFPVTVRLTVR
jgi:endonuclease/exonuclease/phosphatase family metal-dependent hydrolase